MTFPLAGKSLVVKPLDESKPSRTSNRSDVLPLLVALQYLLGHRRDLFIHSPMLFNAPHAAF
jgi:hypothetical protein